MRDASTANASVPLGRVWICRPGDNLQLVLDIAQEQVGLRELPRPALLHIAVNFQAVERLEGLRSTQARIAPAINQGQRLHDEFELANPAKAELYVAIDQVWRSQFALDLPLHRAKLAQRVEVQIAAINETAELADQALPESDRTGNRPRPQQRRPLPGLTEALVEIQRALERHHQRRISVRPDAAADPCESILAKAVR